MSGVTAELELKLYESNLSKLWKNCFSMTNNLLNAAFNRWSPMVIKTFYLNENTLKTDQSDPSSFFSPLRLAPVFVLGMSACRYVTVLYASLPFMVELNPRMWNVPLPKLEFLLKDLCWSGEKKNLWADRLNETCPFLWGLHASLPDLQPCQWCLWHGLLLSEALIM